MYPTLRTLKAANRKIRRTLRFETSQSGLKLGWRRNTQRERPADFRLLEALGVLRKQSKALTARKR